MTVRISKPAINLREELTDLRNQGGYQEQQFYFDSLVTNGTFDADTDWTKGTGWTIGSGVGSCDGTQTSTTDLYQDVVIESGKIYQVSFDITSLSAGQVRCIAFDTQSSINLGAVDYQSSTGTYTFEFASVDSDVRLIVKGNSNFVGSIDNISVFEVDANDDVVHRMPKGWKPKDVFEDGLLQREGAAHDYEVVYDGFDYYVKPTVAPSATTQTCVIGVKA